MWQGSRSIAAKAGYATVTLTGRLAAEQLAIASNRHSEVLARNVVHGSLHPA